MPQGTCGRIEGPVSPRGWCKYYSTQMVSRSQPSSSLVGAGPAGTLDLSFLSASLDPSITWTRANANATTGTFLDPSGVSFSTVLANIPRISVANGLLVEGARTNLLLNSSAPVTQTTASLAIGSYALWVNGAGSAMPSAGTAVGAGFAPATQGNPSSFTLSTAGTVTVTVTGALNRFQLEAGLDASSYVPTAGTTLGRSVDSGVLPTAAWFNAAEGSLVVDFLLPQIVNVALDLPSLSTDTNNNYDFRVTNGALQVFPFVAGSTTAVVNVTGTVAARVVQRAGFTYAGSTRRVAACLSGGLIGASFASSLPAVSQVKFGVVRVAGFNGFVQRIRYWPRALNDSELRGYTA